MKEKELIQIIKSTLNSEYIGDDCAYLKDLGIVVTQDSLVEDIHFSLDYTTPYQLGWKSAAVNISDICASGAKPKYLTISLSLPNYLDENFVKEFYQGAKSVSDDIEIVGGDITGSDKVYISACAIGLTKGRKISSRANAKAGYKIIVSGEHGNSANGLKLLKQGLNQPEKFIKAHLMPVPQTEFSKKIASIADFDYAMMDTSDGLADALIQIADASNVQIKIDTSKIPYDKNVLIDEVLYGGEDYQLVAAVPLDFETKNPAIGEVVEGEGLVIDGQKFLNIDNRLYDHFKEKNEN